MLPPKRHLNAAQQHGVKRLAAKIRQTPGAMRSRVLALAIALAVLASAATWPFARAHLQAMAVLRLVGKQPVPWVIRTLTMYPVQTQEVQFATKAGVVRARVYRPIGQHSTAGPPGLVVLHGVHHLGMNEPRLVSFATAMASCGLSILTPQLPGIADYHVGKSDVEVIGESALWFAGQTGAPVGVLGLSFSGGLALVAAADPAYRNNVKFVLAVGAHDAMSHVANYYLTGQEVRPDGTVERLKPHEYGSLVLEYEHMEDFVPKQDEAAIRQVLQEHLYENWSAEQMAESKLDARQRTEATELMDPGSAKTRAMLAASDAKHLEEMAALSPQEKLRTMTTPVYLLHGQADNIVPAAETLWIAKELPRTTLKEELISPVLSHVNIDEAKPTAWDEWRLVHFFAVMIHAAEKK
jgi:pimeloyl-ACP methyl ester carboxylesterase